MRLPTKVLSCILLALLVLYIFTPSPVFAKVCGEKGETLSEAEQIEQDCRQKLQDLAGQKQTLTTALNTLNTQINLTQAQISKTEKELMALANDIAALGIKIGQIDQSLGHLSEVMVVRVRETYKQSYLEPVYLLFSSQGFPDFINRVKYVRSVQNHDKNVFIAMEQIKLNYDTQKNLKENKQAEVESLKLKLNKQKSALATRQLEKQRLLELTKNDEKKYQDLLQQAQAEYLAIQSILAGQGTETKVKDVKEGEQIASIIQGKSCNSTGTHTHFTITKNGNQENPFSYLLGTSAENCSGSSCGSSDGDQFNPSGNLRWPIDTPIKFLQGYGATWAVEHTYIGRIYRFHNGIDINSPSVKVVAVKDGTLYRGSFSGQSGCALRYVKVEHGDGLLSYYLHVNYI